VSGFLTFRYSLAVTWKYVYETVLDGFTNIRTGVTNHDLLIEGIIPPQSLLEVITIS